MTPEERAEEAMTRTGVMADALEIEEIAREIRAAVAEEREACARLMKDRSLFEDSGGWGLVIPSETWESVTDVLAAAIRARGGGLRDGRLVGCASIAICVVHEYG